MNALEARDNLDSKIYELENALLDQRSSARLYLIARKAVTEALLVFVGACENQAKDARVPVNVLKTLANLFANSMRDLGLDGSSDLEKYNFLTNNEKLCCSQKDFVETMRWVYDLPVSREDGLFTPKT